MKPRLLFLAHRIPYPPNRGDKIRSYHQLKLLAEYYDIYLASCYETETELQQGQPILEQVKSHCFGFVDKTTITLAKDTIKAIARGQSVSEQHFFHSELNHWIQDVIEKTKPDGVFVFCSSMMQYIPDNLKSSIPVVTDLIDLDSEKWRQMANTKIRIKRWLFNREATTVADAEQRCFEQSSTSFFVSDNERTLASRYHDLPTSCTVVENGVDTDFYESGLKMPCTAMVDRKYLVFTGTLDAQPNIKAIQWFMSVCWPKLTDRIQDLHLAIVGRNPEPWIKALSSNKVHVFADVDDVRPYVASAQVAIAPMQIGRGVQNKILEAMAMAKPVVMTNEGARGISMPEEQSQFIADGSEEFVNHVVELLKNQTKRDRIGQLNLEWVRTNYSWAKKLADLPSFFNRKPQ